MPAELRDAVHDAAARQGITVTQLVEQALRAEIGLVTDRAARFAAEVAAGIQQRLSVALADGTWDEAVAQFSAADPDLAR